jgi:ketosteroid isomerase-like protein
LNPTKEEVARSGDLAYEVGTFDLTLGDSEGKIATKHGKYITVWKRQVSGDWKAENDMYNMDL